MEMLPKELLIEIFTYLNFHKLCHLTSTCKLFNEIINNSSTLMNKFSVVYTVGSWKKIKRMMLKKYQRISIGKNNEGLFKYLKCCGKNISEITIYFDKLSSRDLSRILNLCRNLKTLKIYSYCLSDDLIEPLLNFSIDSLIICKKNFHLDKIPEGKILQIRKNLLSKKMFVSLFEQNQSINIELGDIYYFDNDSWCDKGFYIETLCFVLDCLRNSNEENFIKFLKSQTNFRKLIYTSDLYQHFCSLGCADIFKTVKELVAFGPLTKIDVPMPQIETLTVTTYYRDDQNYKEIFPNLKSLSINTSSKFKIAKNLTKNEPNQPATIVISDSVKSLTIYRMGNDSLFDDDVDLKFENLKIHRYGINWLIDCFKNDRIELKSLTLDETKIKKSQQEFLESLTRGEEKKIEKLKIYMPIEFDENHNYVYDYRMEDCSKY